MHLDAGFLDECLEHALQLFSEGEFGSFTFYKVDGLTSEAVKVKHVETEAELIVDTYSDRTANSLLALLRLARQVQDALAVDDPFPMRYSKEFLSQTGLLLRAFAVPLRTKSERALFVGVYGKRHFDNLAAFASFTMSISSLTQTWYSLNLDHAYEYYYPPDSDSEDQSAKWLSAADTVESNLVNWLRDLRVDVDTAQVPPELGGFLHWRGDAEEFSLIAEMDDCFFEVFVADL